MFKLGDVVSGYLTEAQLGFTVLYYDTLKPMLPPTRDKLSVIGGKHGAWDYGAEMQPMGFVFYCYFHDDVTHTEIQAAIRTLNAYLLDGYGRPVTHELIFDTEPDKRYYVRYSGEAGVDTGNMQRRKFSLPLVAFDPVAYGEEVNHDDNVTLSPTTLNYTVTSGLNVYPIITIDNDGLNTIAGFSFVTTEDIFDYVAP